LSSGIGSIALGSKLVIHISGKPDAVPVLFVAPHG